jgi:hypothetical protein
MSYARDPSSLTEILRTYEDKGYGGQFAAGEDGGVICRTCRETSPADEFETEDLRRMEGASDPDDMLAVIALTCPRCSTKGTLVANYGPQATPEDAAVLTALGA